MTRKRSRKQSGRLNGKNYNQEISSDYRAQPHKYSQKNKQKLRIDPARRDFQDRLSAEFDTSIQRLTPIKRKIEMTDHLIDQIVYKLYGLTKDEIKIVEESFEE